MVQKKVPNHKACQDDVLNTLSDTAHNGNIPDTVQESALNEGLTAGPTTGKKMTHYKIPYTLVPTVFFGMAFPLAL